MNSEPYWERLGIALDEALNTLLLNGDPEQTISLHAALAAQQGERWACVLCRVLAALVQHDHCEMQLTVGTTPLIAVLRAGVALLLLVAVLGGLAWSAWSLVGTL